MYRSILYTLAALVCSLMLYGAAPLPKKDDPNRGWVDYEPKTLTEHERLKDRPGNFPVLAAVSQFFDSIYQIRPDYSGCAYPLQLNTKIYASWNDLQEELDVKAANGGKRNKLRQYNVQIRSLSVHNAGTFPDAAEFKKLNEEGQKRFGEVRKRHPGRALVVLVETDLESLQSPKVEAGDVPSILYLVRLESQWRVAWFEDH